MNRFISNRYCSGLFFGRFRKMAKSDYWLRRVRPSACPHENQLPLDGSSWSL